MRRSSIFNFEKAAKYRLPRRHAACFLLAFGISFASLEAANRFLFVLPRSQNFRILDQFLRAKDRAEILLLGDSHFNEALNGAPLDGRITNLSIGGENYIQSYYLLKRCINSMSSLRMVVLPLDLHSFSSFRTDRILEPYFWNRFIDYGDLAKVKSGAILINKAKFLTLLDPTFGRKEFLRNLCSLFGLKLGSHFRPEAGEENLAAKRAQYHFAGADVLDEDLIFYFGRILNLCREKGISVVTVHTPLSQQYASDASKYVTADMLKERILKDPDLGRLIYQHLDYERLYWDRDEFFSQDGDHLNPKGAEAFSQIMMQDLTSLLAAKQLARRV